MEDLTMFDRQDSKYKQSKQNPYSFQILLKSDWKPRDHEHQESEWETKNPLPLPQITTTVALLKV